MASHFLTLSQARHYLAEHRQIAVSRQRLHRYLQQYRENCQAIRNTRRVILWLIPQALIDAYPAPSARHTQAGMAAGKIHRQNKRTIMVDKLQSKA